MSEPRLTLSDLPHDEAGCAGHWLLFSDAREVVGCHCGFVADVQADCGRGDSVVEHLLVSAVARYDFKQARERGDAMSVLDAAQREALRKALEAYAGGRLDFEGFVEEIESRWL